MASVKSGPAGEFRGKIGDVVITKQRGKLVGRDVPDKTTKEPGLPVKSHRSKFGKINKALGKLQKTLNLGFMKSLKGMTGTNAAVKFNFKTVIIGKYPHYEIDYPNLRISNGSLDSIYDPEIVSIKSTSMEIDWVLQINLKMGCNDDDQVYLQVVDTHKNGRGTKLYENVGSRSAGYAKLKLFPLQKDRVYHLYVFVVSLDGKTSSRSKYIGMYHSPSPKKDELSVDDPTISLE